MSFNDLTGKRFNRYTVLERADNSASGKTRWKCKCDCGNIVDVDAFKLTHDIRKMCPKCARKETSRAIEEVGNVYGKLTVVGRNNSSTKAGKTLWNCICECGNTTVVEGVALRNGKTKSCGCLKLGTKLDIRTNLIGRIFGKLTVISEADDYLYPSGQHSAQWLCKCECGNQKIVRGTHLTTGETVSCGCMSDSKGEAKIRNILFSNNIEFEKDKIFEDCKFDNTNRHAKFDFYIQKKNYVIEYDGELHFNIPSESSNRRKGFMTTKYRDDFKNEWCRKNGIKVIRIPYTEIDNLVLEDLLIETSKFKLAQ